MILSTIYHDIKGVRMTDEELFKIESLAININTDLCILKNAMKNNDNNNLKIDDLILFVERIYNSSDDIINVFIQTS